MRKREWLAFLRTLAADKALEMTKQGKDLFLLVLPIDQPSREQDEIMFRMRQGKLQATTVQAEILAAGNSTIDVMGDVYKTMLYVAYTK